MTDKCACDYQHEKCHIPPPDYPQTTAGARCPPSVRGLRPLPDGRAVGARGAAERGASDQTRKSSKGESAQTWIASAGSRIGTISHTYGCRTLFAHVFFVQPDLLLPPWPFADRGCTWAGTSSAHLWVAQQHSVRRCANQTMLMGMVHCNICTFVLTKPLTFTQSWIRERCGRYVIQFRFCSACRLPLRRTPAINLSSHEPTQLQHRDKPVQLALQSLLKKLSLEL